jgi:hypothetical protein
MLSAPPQDHPHRSLPVCPTLGNTVAATHAAACITLKVMVKRLDVDAAALTLKQYAITMMKFKGKAAIEIEKSMTVAQRTVLGGQGVLPLMTTFFVVKYWAIVIAIMMAIVRDNRRARARCIIFRMRMCFLSIYFSLLR